MLMAKQAKAADPGATTASDVMIHAGKVTKTFGQGAGKVTALDAVSVDIRKNEFFTLLGPSGCGKTTLLRLIAGFELPDGGQILLDGQEIGHLPPYKRPVNTVFQSYALFPHMSVARNIGFGLEMQGRPKSEIKEATDRMLALVQMEHLADRRTDQLSGGQQQRVALARALAPKPKVLLLDEPLSALDLKLRKEMQIELKRLQEETGITFVFVTHDQEEALTMSDRIAVMKSGAILQVGAPKQIYNNPARRFVADFIGDINILDGKLAENGAKVVLPGGASVGALLAEGAARDGRVSVAIRPENMGLTAPDATDAALKGRVSNIVYFGAGHNLHVQLDGGGEVMVRRAQSEAEIGAPVGLTVPDAVQVLVD
ncbi:spermidine/putrescine transport system ATP-binding protein [Roseovarius nanhaiticus]|uniref:Spermidine/putrescine import ATP-binding protein PotA n=2 Tax=Roseovarius nanhaiticus TaxID=573024 RepID=A0A1N7GUQ8_9RHOB|nr:spermidine/putrescine transport system ATP-binding protein [Roseovarius nanhaiticus]SIS16325.1 spermidine/putrescine transport system ATP-binding protein [Roseovarius nanhaiticus]